MNDAISTFIFFIAVIDPIGSIPVFIAVTRGYDIAIKRQIAVKAACYAGLILVFFVIAGEAILNSMDIPMVALQVAGGLILFLYAMVMLFGESKPEQEVKMAESGTETAIFPLAVPSIAGPGSMLAVILMTKKLEYNLVQQVQNTLIMLLVVFLTMLAMLGASWIHKLIGNSGASIISRVMGLILASLAVSSVMSGIAMYYGIDVSVPNGVN